MDIQLEEPDSASTEQWQCRDSANATITLSPVVPDESAAGADGLRTIYSEIQSLIRDSECEEDKPTSYSIEKTWHLLEQIAYAMMIYRAKKDDVTWSFPAGYVTSDGCQGIRIEWWKDRTHCVHLIVGKDPNAKEYVFHRLNENDSGKLNKRLLPHRIASQLHQLNQIKATHNG